MVLSSNITYLNSNATVDDGYDSYLVNAGTNNITLTLTSSVYDGIYINIKRIDTNVLKTCVIDPNGNQIDGYSSNYNLGIGESITLINFNSNWYTF